MSYQIFENDTLAQNPAEAIKAKIILDFDTSEAPHFDFEQYRAQARKQWIKKLQKIVIKNDDLSQKAVFYTMMYQSMLMPTLLSDPTEIIKHPMAK